MSATALSASHEVIADQPPLPAFHQVHSLKAGTLTKQGSLFKSWKKRIFILSEVYLFYFVSPDDASPRGALWIKDCVVKEESDLSRLQSTKLGVGTYCFSLHCHKSWNIEGKKTFKERVYNFCCDSFQDMSDWIAILRTMSQRAPAIDLDAEWQASYAQTFGSRLGNNSSSTHASNSSVGGAHHHPHVVHNSDGTAVIRARIVKDGAHHHLTNQLGGSHSASMEREVTTTNTQRRKSTHSKSKSERSVHSPQTVNSSLTAFQKTPLKGPTGMMDSLDSIPDLLAQLTEADDLDQLAPQSTSSAASLAPSPNNAQSLAAAAAAAAAQQESSTRSVTPLAPSSPTPTQTQEQHYRQAHEHAPSMSSFDSSLLDASSVAPSTARTTASNRHSLSPHAAISSLSSRDEQSSPSSSAALKCGNSPTIDASLRKKSC